MACEKALYLDSDTMCLSDVREFFTLDLEGKPIAMVKNATICNGIVDNKAMFDYKTYCNSGVMLFDMQGYKSKNMSEIFDLKLFDQDFLNYIFKDNIKILPFRYNFVWIDWRRLDFESISTEKRYKNGFSISSSAFSKQEIKEAMENPAIVHFCASYKPWEKVDWNYSGLLGKPTFVKNPFDKAWWQFARKTPFYGEILRKYLAVSIKQSIYSYAHAYTPKGIWDILRNAKRAIKNCLK